MNHKSLITEFNRLSALAPKAIKYLHKLTGKTGIGNIYPLEEKKWPEAAWKHYGVLVDLSVIIQDGISPSIVYSSIIKDMKPDRGWVAHVSTGKWKEWSSPQHTNSLKRFDKVYPQIKLK